MGWFSGSRARIDGQDSGQPCSSMVRTTSHHTRRATALTCAGT